MWAVAQILILIRECIREPFKIVFFNLCRVRNLERYFTSPIYLFLLDHLRHRMSNECHLVSFKFELPFFYFDLFCSIMTEIFF